jgi:hypothetical protein
MRKFNDSKVYLWLGIAALAIAIFLGVVTFYSVVVVEPKAEKFIKAGETGENSDVNFKKAYLILRDPHLFAGYKYFDGNSDHLQSALARFDKKIYEGQELEHDPALYINDLLNRRKQGSRLGRNTMVYFLILSALGWVFFIIERVRAARS